ncbi:S8 family serine peptidase [Alteromonas sp. a30]|uniref:S8 family serine peptidase n=1 Tax=Alteromonas sp. a30 TaxID=2730917 RepID=UPI0022803A58|nr:S8 family serine peptidase [Alteromonas sp. a30]MCY7296156.1 S8 family serine peptidase [Alteromonas sp. a30]
MKYLSLCVATFCFGAVAQEATFYESDRTLNLKKKDGSLQSWQVPENGTITLNYVGDGKKPFVKTSSEESPQKKRYIIQLKEPSLSVLKRRAKLQSPSSQNNVNDARQKQILADALSRQQSAIARQQQGVLAEAKAKGIPYSLLGTNHRLVNTLVVEASEDNIEKIKAISGVKAVYEDRKVQAFLDESVPSIGANRVWRMKDSSGRNITGEGIRVAILDTGVDYTHAALGRCLGVNCKVMGGYDFVSDDDDPYDENGHGTHVASIVASSSWVSGVAPDAKIYAYRVLDENADGFVSTIIQGIERSVDPDQNPATDDAVDIINMSLGGGGSFDDILSQASNEAFLEGVLVVAAAGNDGDYESIGSPAAAEHVLTVGSVNDLAIPSSFSSKGSAKGTSYIKPEISAPGENITAASPRHNLKELSGTSMASPHVAGAAALLMQAKPKLSVFEIKSQLISGALELQYEPYVVGSGRLDIAQAVQNNIIVDKPTLFLGQVEDTGDTWVVTKQIRLTNTSESSQTLTLNTSSVPSHTSVSFSESSVTLAPGKSKAISVETSVDISQLTYRQVGIGGWFFSIQIENDDNRLTIPVEYEYNEVLSLTISSAVDHTWILHPETLVTLDSIPKAPTNFYNSKKLSIPKVLLVSAISPFGASIENRSYPEGIAEPFKVGFIVKEVDIQTPSSISISQNDLTRRFLVNKTTRDGAPFDFSSVVATDSKIELLKNGGNLIRVTTIMVCETCTGQYQTEIYTSALPEGADLTIVDNYIGDYDASNYDFFSFNRAYDDFSSSQEVELALSENKDTYWNHKGLRGYGTVLKLGDRAFSVPTGVDEINVSYHFAGELSEASPGPLIEFHDSSDNSIHSTGHWQPNADGTISKRENQLPGTRKGYEVVHTIDSNKVSFGQSLRYWSADAEKITNFLRLTPSNAYIYDSRDAGLVKDSFNNKFYISKDFSEVFLFRNGKNLPRALSYFQDEGAFRVSAFNDSHRIHIRYRQIPVYYNDLFNASVDYEINSPGKFPGIQHLEVTQSGAVSESISRIDNQLKLNVSNGDKSTLVSLAIRKSGRSPEAWRTIYLGLGDGEHTTTLPLVAEKSDFTLKIELTNKNGNRFINTIPYALVIGANANNDNDVDSDGIPDALDRDIDNDGIPNSSDPDEYDPLPQVDTDGDGVIDARENDDDNDTIPDSYELANGLDPLSAADAHGDADNDGLSNLREYRLGTSPINSDTDSDGTSDGDEVALGRDPLTYDKPAAVQDFNGDGFADILYRDNESHQWQVQLFEGVSAPISGDIDRLSLDPAWEFQGTGSFDGDGESDILVRNSFSGAWYAHFMSGDTRTGGGDFQIDNNLDVETQAVADFNLDGYSDLLLRNLKTGDWKIALIGEYNVLEYVDLPLMTWRLNWSVVTAQDMDIDGNVDVLIRDNDLGLFYIYMFNGTEIVYRRSVEGISPEGISPILAEEDVLAVADFDGDHKPDILVRSELTESYRIVLMDGYLPLSAFEVDLPHPFDELEFIAVDDFSGNGIADLILSRDVGESEEMYFLRFEDGASINMGTVSHNKLKTQNVQRLH